MTAWEAVFWDIGGVLLDLESVQRAHRQFVLELVESHDLELDDATAIDRWRTAVGNHFREREGTEFRAARDAYTVGVEALVGEPVPLEQWRPRFRSVVEREIEPIDGAVAAVTAVADWDVHVGVVSDVDDEEGRAILERFCLLGHLDSVTTSEAVGRTKPDPRIFEAALETAGVTADRSLLVGDRYRHDIEGAAAVGIRTVAFGADDGPLVDYRIKDPREVLAILED